MQPAPLPVPDTSKQKALVEQAERAALAGRAVLERADEAARAARSMAGEARIVAARAARPDLSNAERLSPEGGGSYVGQVTDGARCYLATEEREVVSSILRCFPEEFAEHLETGRCPRPRDLVLPKVVDLADGHVVYDESQARKRPDWTYAPA